MPPINGYGMPHITYLLWSCHSHL